MTAIAPSAPTGALAALRAGRRRRATRRRVGITALAVLLVALLAASLVIGQTIYPIGDVVQVLLGHDVPGASFTIGTLRIPRAVAGALAGIAFGLAGSTFQTLLRNPLASPDVIGITSGASAAAVLSITVLGWSTVATNAFALVVGIATALAISLIARGGDSTGGRLILIGIGIGAMLDSVVSFLVERSSEHDVGAAMRWIAGSLNGSSLDGAAPLAIAVVVLAPAILVLSRGLGALELGEQTAVSLGVSASRTRLLLIVCAVALACFATATTGPIAFVAFLSGPIASHIVGRGSSLLIPAALVGACLVLAGDLIGQFAFDTRFPVGVITGIAGAPYLLVLLLRMTRIGGSS
ncbi:FecCD family ABC transporter permease [Microbacterium indicum]|uniref:FecCD family ABC transporter permease n=1 Tax=Microbacterium indicum TaxID=358100 RepID=UPI000415187C|nr:iron chelate uptake ABC transporter family permease subunit [Microbacterium indicum]